MRTIADALRALNDQLLEHCALTRAPVKVAEFVIEPIDEDGDEIFVRYVLEGGHTLRASFDLDTMADGARFALPFNPSFSFARSPREKAN